MLVKWKHSDSAHLPTHIENRHSDGARRHGRNEMLRDDWNPDPHRDCEVHLHKKRSRDELASGLFVVEIDWYWEPLPQVAPVLAAFKDICKAEADLRPKGGIRTSDDIGPTTHTASRSSEKRG